MYLQKTIKVSDTPRRKQEDPPKAFLAELNQVLKKDHGRRVDLQPVYAVLNAKGVMSKWRKPRFDYKVGVGGKPDVVAEWIPVNGRVVTFAAGVMDLRTLDPFIAREDFHMDPLLGRTYAPALQRFVQPYNYLTAPSYWLVIVHSTKQNKGRAAMASHLLGWSIVESRYVPAAREGHFFSQTTLKRGNGVTIYWFTKPTASPLQWKADTSGASMRLEEV